MIEDVGDDVQTPELTATNISKFKNVENIQFNIEETPTSVKGSQSSAGDSAIQASGGDTSSSGSGFQKTNDEPPKYKTAYNGYHTCKKSHEVVYGISDSLNCRANSVILDFKTNTLIENKQVDPFFHSSKKIPKENFSSLGLSQEQDSSSDNYIASDPLTQLLDVPLEPMSTIWSGLDLLREGAVDGGEVSVGEAECEVEGGDVSVGDAECGVEGDDVSVGESECEAEGGDVSVAFVVSEGGVNGAETGEASGEEFAELDGAGCEQLGLQVETLESSAHDLPISHTNQRSFQGAPQGGSGPVETRDVWPSTNCSSSRPMSVDKTCLRHEGKLLAVSLIGKWVWVDSSTILEVVIVKKEEEETVNAFWIEKTQRSTTSIVIPYSGKRSFIDLDTYEEDDEAKKSKLVEVKIEPEE
ncbi:WRKY11 [Artemisia annua]|uniref:WRKY11 n=1 Tax=Artemisia annua TaxID=35608 RepID=A0A2U1MI60_ARTAN|nr:WRKY11 [Artemisia annua]